MNESADFVSYEINLVFEDGKRVHVIDHGDEASIFEQSNHLADFLSVPLWDGRHLEQEEDGLRIPSFVNRGLQLYKWGKTFIVLIIMGLLIWTTYKDLHRSNKEEASYQALSLQSKADMAEIYTNELFEAVVNRKYNVDRLNTLVKRGADVNKKDEKGRTPLFYAVLAKDITMINFLIRSYADIHTKDNQGVGLKDLLDIKKDQHLYFMLEDAALEEKASAQGKTISGISRTLDHAGNVTSVHVVYR
jgi:ankyrin repeat protein